jgi:hypothetical protein
VRKKRAQKPLSKPVGAVKCGFFPTTKIFKENIAFKRRYLSDLPVAEADPNIRIVPISEALPNQMVLGFVGSDGQKFSIIFVATCQVNTDVYQHILRQHVVPWVQRTYPGGIYCFQQV